MLPTHSRILMFGNASLGIHTYDTTSQTIVEFVCSHIPISNADTQTNVHISYTHNHYHIQTQVNHKVIHENHLNNMSKTCDTLQNIITTYFAGNIQQGLGIHAGCVSHPTYGCWLIPAQSTYGKSTFTLGCLNHGFHYLTDELSYVDSNLNTDGLSRPLHMKSGSAYYAQKFQHNDSEYCLNYHEGYLISPHLLHASTKKHICTTLIFPKYHQEISLKIKPITSSQACFMLMQNIVNARNFNDFGKSIASTCTKNTLCYTVSYNSIQNMHKAIAWLMQNSTQQCRKQIAS